MELQPVSELFLTDNAWCKMCFFIFIFCKERVTCWGAISEAVSWLCLQHSSLHFGMSYKQGPSLRIRLPTGDGAQWGSGQQSLGNRTVIETVVSAQQSSWQNKFWMMLELSVPSTWSSLGCQPSAFSRELLWVADGGSCSVTGSFLCWHAGLDDDGLTGTASLLSSCPLCQSPGPLTLKNQNQKS